MAVNCQAAVEAGGCQALDRNQLPMVEDSAGMTIEFLRARLLSERAASRTARQQAQQIAKKVSELQSRLDLEIELRIKAEAAAEKVFAALKIKGVSTEYFVKDECKPLQTEKNEPEEGFLSPDDSKELDSEQQLCDEIYCCIDEQGGATGLKFKMLAGRSQIGDKTGLQDQIAVGTVDAQLCNGDEEKLYNARESKNLNMDGKEKDCEIQDSVSNTIGITEHDSASEHLKTMKGALDESAGERQVIAQKLKGLLQQIEVNVETSSEGQPQKLEQQDIVSAPEVKESSHNVELHESNIGKSLYSEASPPNHRRPEYNNNTTSKDVHKTLSESESFKHAEGLLRLAGKVSSELNELAQKKVDERQTFSQSVKGHYMNGSEIGSGSLDKSQMPIYSEVEQYKTWTSSLAHHPSLPVSQMAHARQDFMVTQWSYPAEIRSSRDMGDSLKSDSDNTRPVVYGHGYLPQTNGTVSESPIEHPHVSVPEVYPHVSVVDDLMCNASDTNVSVYENQETHRVYHKSTAYCQGRAPLDFPRTRECFGFNLPTQKHTRAPMNDTARALFYDKNGSVGDVLTALHLAKLQVKGDEHLPCFPEDRGQPYTRYLGDEFRQLPYDDHHWLSEVPQTPIVQFPSSPSPDRGFSAVDRYDAIIRSNSGSPVPAFEADIQPSGKVHLGNGIILYTD